MSIVSTNYLSTILVNPVYKKGLNEDTHLRFQYVYPR